MVDSCPDCTLQIFINDDSEAHRRMIVRPNIKYKTLAY